MTGLCQWFIWTYNRGSYGLICWLIPSSWRKHGNAGKGKSQPTGSLCSFCDTV